MKILSIALKDLQIYFKDRGVIVQLFVLPLVFIVIFSMLFAASQSASLKGDQRVPLVVVNADAGASTAQAFIDEMESTGGIQVIPFTLEKAKDQFEKRLITHYLVIPQGFSQAVDAGQNVTVELAVLDTQAAGTQSLLLALSGVARDLSLKTHLVASLKQMGEMNASAPVEFQVFTPERLTNQAETQFEASKTKPLVAIRQELPANLQKRSEVINLVQISVPGFTILFIFLAAQTTARSIYDEKKIGSFRRLLAAPLSRFSLLAGKLLPNFIIALVQVVVIFTVSMLLLPLLGMQRLTLGNDLLGLGLAALCTALCSTSLGIVIASLAHTEAQIGGVAALILWVTGFFGGTIVPLSQINSPVFNMISKFVPQSWAVKAFQDLLVRGLMLGDILPSLGVLVLFSVIFFAFGLWRFDFD